MKTRAVGYKRVSGKSQIEGESLTTQEKAIKDYVNSKKGWKLTEMYSDEGLSGGSIKKRLALQRLLEDAEDGKFNVLVIHRLSRFGRNARDLLNNVDHLKKHNISLVSLKEKIDLSNPYGRTMFTMLAAIAELEREIIGEQTKENRIARVKQFIPSVGRLPFARLYNKETAEWSLDEEKANLIRWAADEYIKGANLLEIAHTLKTRHKLKIGYNNLLKVLKERCGDEWVVKFENEKPVVFPIPRILDEITIQAVINRVAFNRLNNRKDIRPKYALRGFLRCEKCGRSLGGQTQKNNYQYYIHPLIKYAEPCQSFNSISLTKIENAVFRTIFENTLDEPSFKKAIQDSLPDADYIKAIKDKISSNKKILRDIEKDLDELVSIAVNRTLRKETIKSRETELYETKGKVLNDLEEDIHTLKTFPDPAEVERDAESVRLSLMRHFGSQERLDEMSYEDKRRLLHFLFDGKDKDGKPWGIYLSKKGRDKWDYFIYGRLFAGTRTMKGDDINYEFWDEDTEEGQNYKTNLFSPD